MAQTNAQFPPPLPPPLPRRPMPPPLPERRYQMAFLGSTREFFGIWFVNLMLSVLTLGIYSAWAKVRTERYFYANTRLAGTRFEYTAEPIRILKGRLIAYVVVIALVLTSNFLPEVYFVLAFVVFLLMPMFIVLSLRFRARYSLWRGISFRFDQPVSDAYLPFMVWKLLSGMTLGLLSPMARMKQHEFIVEGHRYGTSRMRYHARMGDYYRQLMIAVGLGVVTLAALTTLGMLVGGLLKLLAMQGILQMQDAGIFLYGLIMVVAGFYLSLFVLMAFLQVRYTNLLWRSAALGPHRFESTLRARDVIWIYFGNGLAIIFSLGLAVPWAMIRLARYRAEHWALIAMGDLDGFVAASESEAGAAAAELLDALDTGVDFGI